MIIAQGGRFGGWTVFVKDNRLTFVYNVLGIHHFVTQSDEPVPSGHHQLRMEFAYDGGGLAKGGGVTLYHDGTAVGTGRVELTQPMVFSADETTDIGYESGTTVSPDYTAHTSRFTGKIALGPARPRRRRPRPLHRPRGAGADRHGPPVRPERQGRTMQRKPRWLVEVSTVSTLPGRRPVAQAVVRRAQVRPALDRPRAAWSPASGRRLRRRSRCAPQQVAAGAHPADGRAAPASSAWLVGSPRSTPRRCRSRRPGRSRSAGTLRPATCAEPVEQVVLPREVPCQVLAYPLAPQVVAPGVRRRRRDRRGPGAPTRPRSAAPCRPRRRTPWRRRGTCVTGWSRPSTVPTAPRVPPLRSSHQDHQARTSSRDGVVGRREHQGGGAPAARGPRRGRTPGRPDARRSSTWPVALTKRRNSRDGHRVLVHPELVDLDRLDGSLLGVEVLGPHRERPTGDPDHVLQRPRTRPRSLHHVLPLALRSHPSPA